MNTMDLFQKEAPEVAKAFNGLIESIVESKGIDAKTKQLIYIALKRPREMIRPLNFMFLWLNSWGQQRKK